MALPNVETNRYHRIESAIWCHYHGQVHENEEDPFDEGGDGCVKINFQALYMYGKASELDGT